MKPILASAALFVLLSGSAGAQVQRALGDCSRVPAENRAACESRNVAVTQCRLETDERFAACVSEAMQNPAAPKKPGFSKTGKAAGK